MNAQPNRSLPSKVRRLFFGNPDRPLHLKIHAKVMPVAIVSAFILCVSHSDRISSYRLANKPERVQIAHIESSTRVTSFAFVALGAGVLGAYLLAAADRLALAQSQQTSVKPQSGGSNS